MLACQVNGVKPHHLFIYLHEKQHIPLYGVYCIVYKNTLYVLHIRYTYAVLEHRYNRIQLQL